MFITAGFQGCCIWPNPPNSTRFQLPSVPQSSGTFSLSLLLIDPPLPSPDLAVDPTPNSDQPSSPPREAGPRCTNIPCSKIVKLSDEWGMYYCSEECLVQHSRSAGAGDRWRGHCVKV